MSNESGEAAAAWRVAHQLLQSGQYDQVAALLEATIHPSAQAVNPLLAATAATAHQLCLACIQSHADVEWYRHAHDGAMQREEQLRQNAQLILERLINQETLSGMPGGSSVELPARVAKPLPLTPHRSLRQRIQQLLEQSKRLVLPGHDKPMLPEYAQVTPQTSYNLPEVEPPLTPPTTNLPELSEPADPPVVEQVESTPGPEEAHLEASSLPEVASATITLEIETTDEPTVPPTDPGAPTLTIYCLGAFRVYQDDQLIADWPSGKGLSIFKYLVTHRERPVAKEVLMELFWADASPEAARNNLNVAIYGLRRALRKGRPDFSHLLFQDDFYLLNPELEIWVDIDAFAQHHQAGQDLEQKGQQTAAIDQYRGAEALYSGEFLAEDRYEDWPSVQRRHFQDDYLNLLDRLSRYYLEHQEYNASIEMAHKILAIDSCREDAHCRLMRCYSRQGYLNLALRQYHLCEEALKRELDVSPDPATQKLWSQIRRRQSV